MSFPCVLCGRCTARTNDGALFCLNCAELPAETQRAALERHLGLCPDGWHLDDYEADTYDQRRVA